MSLVSLRCDDAVAAVCRDAEGTWLAQPFTVELPFDGEPMRFTASGTRPAGRPSESPPRFGS